MVLAVTVLKRCDGVWREVRPAPLYVSSEKYARCARAMRSLSATRGTLGLAVDTDPQALAWQAWNEAGLRQLAWMPGYPLVGWRDRWTRPWR